LYSTGHIDWLSITFPHDFDERILEVYLGKFKTIGSGSHGYARRAQSNTGAILLADGEKRQGKSLTLPGDTLANLRSILDTDAPILDMLARHAGHASRIDLALNLLETSATPAILWEHYRRGLVRTKARGNLAITTVENGVESFYIGSRKSDKFLRVYDKALEQKLTGKSWTRLELECRKLIARAYVESMTQQKSLRPFINRAIAEYADFPASDDFREATTQDDANLPILGRKEPQFWRWMNSQVVPAMVSRQMDRPEENVGAALNLLFQRLLAKRQALTKAADPLLDNED
jgi:hypothetical protein